MRLLPLIEADDVAMCLEVCPETYSVDNVLRLHIHMFFKSQSSYLRFRQMAFFDFEGSTCSYRLVLASNNWHTSLTTLSDADQEWIHLKCIVVDVEEPMWEA